MGAAFAAHGAQGLFTDPAPARGWRLEGSAELTAPAIDPPGRGWLRLTGNANNARGSAEHTGPPLRVSQGFVVSLSYAAWGGGLPGADGISLFLFDPARGMAGAGAGGGLGYCKGAGAWLGLGLDEFGNFSHPADDCAGSGPGTRPQSLVLRGPTADGNRYIAGAPVPGRLDLPETDRRPQPAQVVLTARPRADGPGFRVTADWRPNPTVGWIRVLHDAEFPYAAPPQLQVGVAASTGAARNVHEVRELAVRPLAPPSFSHRFEPAQVAAAGKSRLILEFGGSETARLLSDLVVPLPGGVEATHPAILGGTCPGAVTAPAGSSAIRVHADAVVRKGGCRLTVEVIASQGGEWSSSVEAGALVTDSGANEAASTATLKVTR